MNNNFNPENLDKIFDFLHKVGKLKLTFRFSEIKNTPKDLKDSSAAHSWRLAYGIYNS